MKKFFLTLTAALLGICLAVLVHCSFMLVEAGSGSMLPSIAPGQKALIYPVSYTHLLKTLDEVGLGYIKLGQPSTQLSGGEAQRVKLATELSKRSTGKTLYILDEPTTGLHFADVDKLISVLDKLVEAGNTVVVIEHNLDVIKRADHIIDLGPDGGDRGGSIVTTGTPEEVAKCKKSYTGQFLKKLLK